MRFFGLIGHRAKMEADVRTSKEKCEVGGRYMALISQFTVGFVKLFGRKKTVSAPTLQKDAGSGSSGQGGFAKEGSEVKEGIVIMKKGTSIKEVLAQMRKNKVRIIQ